MYIHSSLLFVALMISWLVHASCSTNSNSYNLLLDQQPNSCSSDGIPVCGSRDKQLVLFSNSCLLKAENTNTWLGETVFTKVPLQNCIPGCKFSCPKTYKPICTRNKQTYRKHLFKNQCELNKRICRKNEDYQRISSYECLSKFQTKVFSKAVEKRAEVSKKQKKRPIPCTNVFRPVCGSYLGVKSSFKNECLLNAENVAFNRDWRIVKNGMCPEDYFKTRHRKDQPAEKTHSLKKRSFSNGLLDQHTVGSVSPNDLYLYMPSTLQDDFLNHDTSSYHHHFPKNTVYNEYLETFTPLDESYTEIAEEASNEEPEKPYSKETIISSLPFAADRQNFNYLTNKRLAHEINQQSSFPNTESMEPIEVYKQKQIYYAFKTVTETNIENVNNEEMPIETYESVEKTELPETSTHNSLKGKSLNKQSLIRSEEILEPKTECKSSSISLCATLTNGTLRTFETICDMMDANVDLRKKWTKLHDGPCENCKYNCSRDYEPVCISKNGVNYTIINECYYNMSMCMDKKSNWQMLANKECDHYTRLPDKYNNTQQGFVYPSRYYAAETTTLMPSTEWITQAISGKQLKVKKSGKNTKRKDYEKRELRKKLGSNKCCSRSNLRNKFSEDAEKCKCWSDDTTQESLSEPPLYESQTDSFIMHLIRKK